jgi:hypothetical protein
MSHQWSTQLDTISQQQDHTTTTITTLRMPTLPLATQVATMVTALCMATALPVPPGALSMDSVELKTSALLQHIPL